LKIAEFSELSELSKNQYRFRMIARLNLKSLPELISYAIKYSNTNKILGND